MNDTQLFFANPRAQLKTHRANVDAAIQNVLDSGSFIQGQAHNDFECQFSAYLGVRHAVGVANGTDALVLALMAIGVADGDEVIVPSHTAPPTISAIRQVNAIPVFVDVDARTYVVTPEIIANAITKKTKAIIAVHLYGYPCDAHKIKALADDHGLYFIEDCAQATGAIVGDKKVGTIGHIGTFSFFPTKNLGAIGDGGAVVTSDNIIAKHLKCLRCYGWSSERICIEDGINSRLDDIQAAILSAKLPYLDSDNERRRQLASLYDELLKGLPVDLPLRPMGNQDKHVFHLYVIAVSCRDALIAHLKDKGIVCGVHYAKPTHQHPAFSRWAKYQLPATENLTKKIVSLPIYPELCNEDVVRVCQTIRSFIK